MAALEAQLRERTTFLRNLTPAASFTRLWKNHDSELLVAASDNGRYRATYGNKSFGWAKYQCHSTADFGTSGAADKGLAAAAAHIADLDENTTSTLFMTRNGPTLTLSEEFPDNVGDAPLPRICPHGGDFREPFFHTGLRADDARRLKPDE